MLLEASIIDFLFIMLDLLQLAMLDFCQEQSRGGRGMVQVTRLAVYCNYLNKKKKKNGSYVKIFIQAKH